MSVFLYAVIIFSSCKDENEVGLDVLPPTDQLATIFSDSTKVITSSEPEDSLRSDEVSAQLIGSTNDPVFGVTTASVFTQVVLEGTPTFSNNPVADSLVLDLVYSGYNGDTNVTQNFSVYRIINETLRADSSYYFDRIFDYDHTPLGTLSFTPQPGKSVVVGNDTVPSRVRITLDHALADSLISFSGSAQYQSNTAWVDYFKGIFIDAAPVTGQGAISYFNFFESSLILYFHDSVSTFKTYNFSLAGARTNHFAHDYTGSPAGMQLANPATGDSVNYLQTTSGIRTKISFPYLKHFLDSGSIQINRADLTIEAQPGTLNYPLPSQLLLITHDAGGARAFPIDYYESSGYFGGALNVSTNKYVFNIAREVQRYLNGTITSVDFYLIPSSGSVEYKRAVIRSGSNASPVKLALYYTKLN